MGLDKHADINVCPYCENPISRNNPGAIRNWCHACREWRYSPYKDYSTDISAAWQVVEKLKVIRKDEIYNNYALVEDIRKWQFGCGEWEPYEGYQFIKFEVGTTPAHAICLGALRMVGHEV